MTAIAAPAVSSDRESRSAIFRSLRAREFSRLDDAGEIYLDYTGGGLYAASQVRGHADFLSRVVLGNPHSDNPSSTAATKLLDRARQDVLEFFGADPAEYDVCFTANASGALKLVGESFPFEPRSRLVLCADNHNSVNGLREFASARGARLTYLPLDRELRMLRPERDLGRVGVPGLLAYPAQSNFSGVRHPLSLIPEAQRRGYSVVLDAAAYVPTSPLDLAAVKPDFVCISFYKMFGYPTGVGALIGRRTAMSRLRRPWFAGGTVDFASVQHRMHQPKSNGEAFEDGTVNFLAMAAVSAGLALLRDIGMERINRRVGELTELALEQMSALAHVGGNPMVQLYGPGDTDSRGGTIAFKVADATGRTVPHQLVESAAGSERISLRGGCFCNPGAAEAAFGFPKAESRRCLESFRAGEFSVERFGECMGGVQVGALRASFGIATNESDIDRLVHFIDHFASSYSPNQ